MSTTVIPTSPFVIDINPYAKSKVSWEVISWNGTGERLSGGTVHANSNCMWDLVRSRIADIRRTTLPSDSFDWDEAAITARSSITVAELVAGARAEAEAYVDRYMEHGGGSYGYPPVSTGETA